MAQPAKKPSTRTRRRPDVAPQARALEWGFGIVSGLLVVALLGYLAVEGLRTPTPPDFVLAVRHVERFGATWQVSVEVENTGDSAAADVAVRGVVAGGGEPETSETLLDFLPPRSTRETVLLFARDPIAGKLALSVRGYNQP